MKRRDFLLLSGAAAGAWPLLAHAQQSPPPRAPGGRPWLIGAFITQTEAQSELESVGPFGKALAALGYVRGRDFVIEARFANGDATRYPALAKEVLALSPDLIFVSTGGAANVAGLTSSIPIIATSIEEDAVAPLIGSLARPNKNVTGLFTQPYPDQIAKNCEVAVELIPGAKRVGVLLWSLQPGGTGSSREQAVAAADALKVVPMMIEVAQPVDIAAAFKSFAESRADVVVVGNGNAFSADRQLTVAAATAVRMPAVYNNLGYAQAGGLLSYGGDRRQSSIRLASYADLIFRGAKPGDLPIEQSSSRSLAINLKTARSLALTVPPTLLFRADVVIE